MSIDFSSAYFGLNFLFFQFLKIETWIINFRSFFSFFFFKDLFIYFREREQAQ